MKDLLSRPPRPSPNHRWVTTLAVYDRYGNLEREEGYWYDGPWTYAHANPVVAQSAFVGVNDDGSLTTATEIAADNANWSQDVDTTFRIRFQLQETNGGSANNENFVLYYSLNSAAYAAVDATTPIQFAANGNSIADGAAISAERLGTAISVNGEFDQDGAVTNITLSSDTTEMEYCLTIDSTQVNDTDTIAVRVYNGPSALDTYTNTPTITVVESAPVIVTLAGTISSVSTVPATAELDAQSGLGGTAASASTVPATAELTSIMGMGGTISSASTVPATAEFTSIMGMGGTISSASTVPATAELTSIMGMGGTISSASTVPATGELTIIEPPPPFYQSRLINQGLNPYIRTITPRVISSAPVIVTLAGTISSASTVPATAELDNQPGLGGTDASASSVGTPELDNQPGLGGTDASASSVGIPELDNQSGLGGTDASASSVGTPELDNQPGLGGTDASASSVGTPELDNQPPLSGTVASASSVNVAELDVAVTLGGSITSASSVTVAELAVAMGTGATVPSLSGGSAELDAGTGLGGTIPSASALGTPELDRQPPLDGTIAAASTTGAADLDVAVALGGTVPSLSGGSAELDTTMAFGGTIAAASTTNSALLNLSTPPPNTFYQARRLDQGLNPYIRVITPPVPTVTIVELAGVIPSLSSVTGDLSLDLPLGGTTQSDSSLTAELLNITELVGDPAASTSILTGALDQLMELAGSTSGISQLVANLLSGEALATVVNTSSGGSAELSLIKQLGGQISSHSTLQGDLPLVMGMEVLVYTNTATVPGALWQTMGVDAQVEVVSTLLAAALSGTTVPAYQSLSADRLHVVAPLDGSPSVEVAIQTEFLTILARNPSN